MAEPKARKRRVVKKSVTVRQQRESAAVAKPKQRSVKNVTSKASSPLRVFGRAIAKVLRPFSFLLWPFKTRPARFIGRILAKIFFVNYIRKSWAELRLVEWPNRRETAKLTFAVIAFAVTFGLMITVVDLLLDKVFKQILT